MPSRSDGAPALDGPVRRILDSAWREPGYCVPNAEVYPHQWLWDSCFHSLIWIALGDDRALTELTNAMAHQDEATGFVPHMTYWDQPDQDASFWGRRWTSAITQPPMYGHALARIVAAGLDPPSGLVAAIERALAHLLVDRVRTPGGLVAVFHPWETGCDDSPRWDGFRRRDQAWALTKSDLVDDLVAGGGVSAGLRVAPRAPSAEPFVVGSIGFNALVAWNARQYLDEVDPADRSGLRSAADELASAVASRWDPGRSTWVDDGPASGGIRTLDALLALLVDPRDEAFDQLVDPDAFGARFGPCGVHRAEESFDPCRYWRGPAWPQLTYLLWAAAVEAARTEVAGRLATGLVEGAVTSGWGEYWHPDTGGSLGARPQTWAGLAHVVGTGRSRP